MSETSLTQRNESTNWLTIFPAKSEQDRNKLKSLMQDLGDFPDTQQIVMTLSDVIDSGMLNGKKVSDRDLNFLKSVLAYISKGIKLGLDEVVSLRLRRITDNEIKKHAQEQAEENKSVEVWSYYSGDYRGQLIGESEAKRRKYPLMPASTGDSRVKGDEKYVPHEKAGDTVHFLSKRIEYLLDKKSREPVVLIDIGAMYGMTLLELANQFRAEVLAGKLVLIATNIGLTREVIEKTPKPRNGTGLYQNYGDLYQKAGSLVHFLVTDVEGLVGKKIDLPNGQEFTLQSGSVDIVHENWSISKHSKSLEYDVAQIASLAGDKGIIMSNRHDLTRGSGGLSASDVKQTDRLTPSNFSLSSLSRARSDELRQNQDEFGTRNIHSDILIQSNQTLLNNGFQLVEYVRDPYDHQKHQLNYSFWMGRQTEPLDLFNNNGNEIIVDGKKSYDSLRKIIRKIFRVT